MLVEITAKFDEAPNIAWGEMLEKEGVHVAYGVERLKTHVKLALVVREEDGRIRRYAHIGTGNYHTGTAKIYEDLGILTCDREICEAIGPVLAERGLIFVGIDVIGGYLTEINVTSPTGLQEINRFNEVSLETGIWDAIETHLAARHAGA